MNEELYELGLFRCYERSDIWDESFDVWVKDQDSKVSQLKIVLGIDVEVDDHCLGRCDVECPIIEHSMSWSRALM